jgi:hypothetical protein
MRLGLLRCQVVSLGQVRRRRKGPSVGVSYAIQPILVAHARVYCRQAVLPHPPDALLSPPRFVYVQVVSLENYSFIHQLLVL